MSCLGKPEFEFERLCSIFGLAAVRRASIQNFSLLQNLESYLALVEEDIKQRREASFISLF